MPTFKELAVIAGTGESSRRARLAAAGSGDLAVTAWLVHQHMLGEAQRSHAPEVDGAEEGATWLRWAGTLAASLRALQLIGDFTKDTEESMKDSATRRRATDYLRKTGNAICLHSTNGMSATRPTIWAIRTEFREGNVPDGVIRLSGSSREADTSAKSAPPPARPLKAAGKGTTRTRRKSAGLDRPFSTAPRRKIQCPQCVRQIDSEQMVRHLAASHELDVAGILLELVQRSGPLSSLNLAVLFSARCGGGVVSTSYVNENLQPAVYDSHVPLSTRPGDGSRFAYHWDGPLPVPVTPVTPVNAVTSSAPPAPAPQPAALQLPAPALLVPAPHVPPSPPSLLPSPPSAASAPPASSLNGSAAPAPARPATGHFGAVADALQRARAALDEASEAAAAIVAENEQLRGYQSRVRQLLEVAEVPAEA